MRAVGSTDHVLGSSGSVRGPDGFSRNSASAAAAAAYSHNFRECHTNSRVTHGAFVGTRVPGARVQLRPLRARARETTDASLDT